CAAAVKRRKISTTTAWVRREPGAFLRLALFRWTATGLDTDRAMSDVRAMTEQIPGSQDSAAESLGQGDRQFRALLTPHRSLSPTGFMILMGAVCLVSFGTGLLFYLLGAWPVIGFMGLDVLLIYVAFRLNYREGRLYELVDLKED